MKKPPSYHGIIQECLKMVGERRYSFRSYGRKTSRPCTQSFFYVIRLNEENNSAFVLLVRQHGIIHLLPPVLREKMVWAKVGYIPTRSSPRCHPECFRVTVQRTLTKTASIPEPCQCKHVNCRPVAGGCTDSSSANINATSLKQVRRRSRCRPLMTSRNVESPNDRGGFNS